MRYMTPIRARQRGAALAIGLILLLVLTVLAVSGMNTASMELVMAGNEQYRQRAFHAAESGIELALVDMGTVGQTVPKTVTPAISETTAQVETTTEYMGDGSVPGSGQDIVGYHYQITSTGSSSRNSRSVLTQGAYIVQNVGSSGTMGSILPNGGVTTPPDGEQTTPETP